MAVIAWISLLSALILVDQEAATLEVAAARFAIAPGTVVSVDLVEVVELPSDSPLADELVRYDEFEQATRLVAQRAIAPGDPITHADVARR